MIESPSGLPNAWSIPGSEAQYLHLFRKKHLGAERSPSSLRTCANLPALAKMLTGGPLSRELRKVRRMTKNRAYNAGHGVSRTRIRVVEYSAPRRFDPRADSHCQARRPPRLFQ